MFGFVVDCFLRIVWIKIMLLYMIFKIVWFNFELDSGIVNVIVLILMVNIIIVGFSGGVL